MLLDDNQATCARCGRAVDLTPDNAALFYFLAQPWFTYWQFQCDNPECNWTTKVFCRDKHKQEFEWALRNEVGIVTEMFPHNDYNTAFERLYEVRPLQERELTQQDEKNVLFLRWLLNHYDTRFFDDPERGEP